MGRYLYNIRFWEKYIKTQFIKQVELLTESIQNRLIPTFDSIEREAEELSEKEWDIMLPVYPVEQTLGLRPCRVQLGEVMLPVSRLTPPVFSLGFEI